MQIRVLNLERSTDRLALFQVRNAHTPSIVKTKAVDGKMVDRKRLSENNVITDDLLYSDGALGCALSHLTQWRDVIQSEAPLTIVEDDVVLANNFASETERLIAELPEDWEYVMWGWGFDALMTFDLLPGYSHSTSSFDQESLRKRSRHFSSEHVDSRLFRLRAGFGTIAYSISPLGARRLMQFCMPLRPLTVAYPGYPRPMLNTGIDNMMGQAWPHMAAYVAFPPLAVTDNHHASSTIRGLPRTSRIKSAETFPIVTLRSIAEMIATPEPVAIGISVADTAELCTSVLRQVGWSGFDIAADVHDFPAALQDRAVAEDFELLYLGEGCSGHDILSRILPSHRPMVVIVAPEPTVSARYLWQSEAPPLCADLMAAHGYVRRIYPEISAHAVFFRGDVDHTPERPAPAAQAPEPQTCTKMVRLWH